VSVSAGTKGERRSTSSKQWVVEQLQPAVSLRTGRTSGAGVVDCVLALTHTGVGAIPVGDNNQPQMELHESVWDVRLLGTAHSMEADPVHAIGTFYRADRTCTTLARSRYLDAASCYQYKEVRRALPPHVTQQCALLWYNNNNSVAMHTP
jgi:hypothetical protein